MTSVLDRPDWLSNTAAHPQRCWSAEDPIAPLPGVNHPHGADLDIVGAHAVGRSQLLAWAASPNLWIRRIAILSTFSSIRRRRYADTLANMRSLDEAAVHYRKSLALAPPEANAEQLVGLWHVKV